MQPMGFSYTIELPDASGATLEELGRRQHKPAEDVARDLLERALAAARLKQIQERLEPYARAAGCHDENNILRDIA